jgi:hypothetical protein
LSEALDFPFPPTTHPSVAGPPTSPSAPAAPPATPAALPTAPPAVAAVPAPPAPAPEVGELTALRAKVDELDRVIALAKTRVETLGAEKREALERALRLEAELEAAQQREAELLARLASVESPASRTFDDKTVAELLDRVAALEAIVAPSRAA